MIDALDFWPSDEKATKTTIEEYCRQRIANPEKELKSKGQIAMLNIETG